MTVLANQLVPRGSDLYLISDVQKNWISPVTPVVYNILAVQPQGLYNTQCSWGEVEHKFGSYISVKSIPKCVHLILICSSDSCSTLLLGIE